MTDFNDYLLKFWAKTSSDEHRPKAFHPLICHMIDVAVVTRLIWDKVLATATRQRISRALGLENARDLVGFIAGLHDLGKCSPPFALRGLHENKQTTELLKMYRGTPFDMSAVCPSREVPHGYVTAVELPQILETGYSLNRTISRQISTMIGGHHGIFPTSGKLLEIERSSERSIGNDDWKVARVHLASLLASVLNFKSETTDATAKLDNGTIMILAGLVSVADWIGSDTQFFECAIDDFNQKIQVDFSHYVKRAEECAENALGQLGWLNWAQIDQPKEFQSLFSFSPRGLQTEAIAISEELNSPGIVVIESPMGEGKTEAAMFLADTFNAKLGQRGIYFALPTQATSNQMFGRVEKFLSNRFERGDIHLLLQHGHSSLSAEFDTLKENFQNIQGLYEECSGGDCVPHVVAAEWFTYRKRGLLAPFGVGTIDQALMAVLQTKHVFVRLFGLAHKTIIIDEVHAYDAYMSTLLERLLEWLAALGSPVILLSATLPRSRRDALVKAYQKGLPTGSGASDAEPSRSDGPTNDVYPRISYATDLRMKVRKIKVSTKTQTLNIKKIDDSFVGALKEKLKGGGCAAIICNTVARSQEIYQLLSEDEFFQGNDEIDGLPTLNLLHSRFRFCDRDRIEQNVRIRFGKPADKIKVIRDGKEVQVPVKRPKRAVLVATQIIEQSLDIDFDLMISDLAPIDLLLQRAGRLFRHERLRPNEFNQAELWIVQPEINDDLPDFGIHKVIYAEHILLRTWLELQSIEEIEIPGEIERLIEAVYDRKRDCSIEKYLSLWELAKKEMDNKLKLKRAKAKTCRITDADDEDLFENVILQLDEDNPEAHKTFQALMRDNDLPSVSIVALTYKEAKSIDLDAMPSKERIEFLLRREAKISKKGLTHLIITDENLKQENWKISALLRHHRLLKLDENNEIVIGNFKVSLDVKLGIMTEKIGGKNE